MLFINTVDFLSFFWRKNLKLISYGGYNFVIFDLSLMLLLVKVDPILEEQNDKIDAFIALGSSDFEIVLALLTEVITFYI